MRARTIGVALAVALLLAVPGAASAHTSRLSVPEFTCRVAMSTPGLPQRACVTTMEPGDWHIDLSSAYLLEGSYSMNVRVVGGRYVEISCQSGWDPLGTWRVSCSTTFAGLGSEAGSSTGVADSEAYLHVAVPSEGTVTVSGGEGRGFALIRGARRVFDA